MKKTFQIFMVAFTFSLMFACSSSNRATQMQQNAPVNSNTTNSGINEVEIETPCSNESMDNKEYFKGLGIGTDLDRQLARTASLGFAQQEINMKLGGFIQGLATDYSRTVSGQGGQKTQSILERETPKIVEKMLNDAEKICEKTTIDNKGAYHSYIVLQIPKKELLDNLINSISQEEELNIEFNRSEFREFAEEKMEKMKEAQKNK